MTHNGSTRGALVPAAVLAAMLLWTALPLLGAPEPLPLPGDGSGTPCIVVLGDPHLPYKKTDTKDAKKGEALVRAKEGVIDHINGWTGVTRVVAVGDLVGTWGTDEEYRFASETLGRIRSPLVVITGNHDYIYQDTPSASGGLLRASPSLRSEKLRRFMTYFHLSALQREEKVAGYELIYLSTDSTDERYEVGLSKDSLQWLDETLRNNSTLPTIIFYHAPLAGTVLSHGTPTSTWSEWAAQPSAAIDEILKRNPQVFLWVSGHTHTPPSDPSFASPLNLYDGRVTDVHCPDLGHERIYTNILWLYPDHVLVRTFDHGSMTCLPDKDRSIAIPGGPAGR